MPHQPPIDNVIHTGGVLIVGAGLAGLFTALKFEGPVTILSAASLGSGASIPPTSASWNTSYAPSARGSNR